MTGACRQKTLHSTTSVDKIRKAYCINPLGLGLRDFCFLVTCILLLGACRPQLKKTTAEEFQVTIQGEAQGTTWTVSYFDLQERDFTDEIDSLLKAVDASVSTYLEGSVIDRWNKSDSGMIVDSLFVDVLFEAATAHRHSRGAFDPTVKPLVSYYGFGPEKFVHPTSIDTGRVDSLLKLVGFDALLVLHESAWWSVDSLAATGVRPASVYLKKPGPGVQLDFNAIAQGWSVDLVAALLELHEIDRFFVEIGGEIVAGKPKPDGSRWRFGIDKPVSNLQERTVDQVIQLRNRGLATSGSYRKFYEVNGKKLSHTIDPADGFPVQHGLLSATVVSSSAAQADAMATAFMVMGADSTRNFLEEHDYLNHYVYLIYDSAGISKTFTSPAIRSYIEVQ